MRADDDDDDDDSISVLSKSERGREMEFCCFCY